MEHDFEPTTKVCLRCFITKAEARAFDPPAMCGQVLPVEDIAEKRKRDLIRDGLYRDPAPAVEE